MSPRQAAALRPALTRFNAAQARARNAYRAAPDARRRAYGGDCAMPYCGRPVHGRGRCWRHREVGV